MKWYTMGTAESNCTEQGESKKELLFWVRCLQKSSLKTWVWIVLQGMANPEVGWKGQSASCASRDIDWKNYQPRVNLQIPTTSVPGRLVGSQEFKGTTVQFQGPNGRQITAILNRQWDHSLHKLQDKERESSQTLSTVWSKSKLLSKVFERRIVVLSLGIWINQRSCTQWSLTVNGQAKRLVSL